MARISTAQRIAEARYEGMQAGRLEMKTAFEQGRAKLDRDALEAKIKLINAVGQTLQTQASLLAGLAQVFDNGPR